MAKPARQKPAAWSTMNIYMNPITPPTSEQNLLESAQALAGLSLAQIAARFNLTVPKTQHYAKGWIGELLELQLGATAQSRPEPDFINLGVELKTIPINHLGKPKESTFVCSINLQEIASSTWETSTVWRKLQRVLWVPIEAEAAISLAERRIGMPLLWSPTLEQIDILRADWQELTDMISLGELNKISAKLGHYLQIRPKGANARSLCWGTDELGEPALTLPRGFYLRTRFTEGILATSYSHYTSKSED